MLITVLASGSSGNCYVVTENGTSVIIDAGISMKKIREGVEKALLKLSDISGILVTHEHSDHISGLPMLIKHYDIPIYTTNQIAIEINRKGICDKARINIIEPNKSFIIGNLSIKAFNTPHDSADSVGYVFGQDKRLGFATDTGCVTENMRNALKGVSVALIEANHDVEMLKNGSYPAFLKRRILSDTGHLSNEKSGELALFLESNGTKKIILGHLSKDNNTPEKAKKSVEDKIVGSAEIYVAPATGFLEVSV